MMKTQNDRNMFTTSWIKATAPFAVAAAFLLSPLAQADVLSQYQPEVLLKAEQALEQGQPERALSLLHSQRAILSHGKFRAQGLALTCDAYVQQQDYDRAEDVCADAVAFSRDQAAAENYVAAKD
jgi:hypothetical protein